MDSKLYERIYAVVRRIPRGRVASYGQVAELAGLPRQARLVGYALHALDEEDGAVPWQRVINARGEVSRRSEPGTEELQRVLLEAEGVPFDARGRVDLARYRWNPRKVGRPRNKQREEIERHAHGSPRDRL
jgi:methylated-DNA-protein-cysteine methyltransferase-like protein